MYKYGISYFTVSESERVPVTGLDVRLVEPNGTYELGVSLPEMDDTGYYGGDVVVPGFYEIWDDNGGTPQFSGRTCVIGPVDSAGIANGSIEADKLADGSVKTEKIATSAVETKHIGTMSLNLQQIAHEVATELDGVGRTSASTPAVPGTDGLIDHALKAEYSQLPFVIVVTHCDALLWVDRVAIDNGAVTVTLGVSLAAKAAEFKYQILAVTDLQE